MKSGNERNKKKVCTKESWKKNVFRERKKGGKERKKKQVKRRDEKKKIKN